MSIDMRTTGILFAISLILGACAPQQRMGMVVDPQTQLQYGSVVERNILIDSSQFNNKKLKLRIRNISGDPAFDLHGFRARLVSSYTSKGYDVTESDDFGLLVDVNVVYSGQMRTDLRREFGFLGAASGGTAGAIAGTGGSAEAGLAIGVISGAALGAIIGSYVTEDTYIVVARYNVAVADQYRGEKKTTIVFSSSGTQQKTERSNVKPFEQRLSSGIAVYAGGRNTPQARISDQVRQRFARILTDMI
jgi:hypothetical protein